MKAGPQPPACVVESCSNIPADGMVGYCAGHKKLYANGSAVTPPIVEPDDPELLEREAKKAAAAEEAEYAERRRVKTWKTLENGTRVPEEYWSDEELATITKQASATVERVAPAKAPPDMSTLEPVWDGGQWVLRPKTPDVDLDAVRALVRDLMLELGL